MPLTPVLLDTAGVGPDTTADLSRLDGLVRILLRDYAQHPMPLTFIHLGPHELDKLDPLAFASFVVAHRAERLVQCVELGAAALDGLEHGSLQLAASAARMLLELAFVTADVHRVILETWYEAHGSTTAVLAVASTAEGPLWQALWKARLGTRVYTEPIEGVQWPSAMNVQTRQDRFGKGDPEFVQRVEDLYASLCEAVHPNVEAQGVLWRFAPPLPDGRQRLAFEPSASQSPVKVDIADTVVLAYGVLLPYCRDLWWIAAETACAGRFRRTEETVSLGVPLPGGSRVSCCCGSGAVAATCDHPEPPLPSSELTPPGEPPSESAGI